MPGSALISALTTLRIDGTTDTSRSTRMIRSARMTDNGPAAGIQAIVTIVKSNRFHPSLKKRVR